MVVTGFLTTVVLCVQSAWCYLTKVKAQAGENDFERENTITADWNRTLGWEKKHKCFQKNVKLGKNNRTG